MTSFYGFTELSVLAMLTIFSTTSVNQVDAAEELTPQEDSTIKNLYLPKNIGRVPEGNDFDDPNSEFCYQRMVQGDNVAIFWNKEYGDDPMKNSDENKRFDVNYMLKECERIYQYYVNELKMVEKGKSISDKHKMLVIVFGGDEATAYGGDIDGEVGALWTPAVRVHKTPYGVLAHEMGHCFQAFSRNDTGHGPRGAISEMSAQYLLWQVYPEWMTFENYHLVDFMKQTHYAFLHPINMYHSPYVLEYWSNKHGKEFFGKLSRETESGEDPVMTYKRLNGMPQEQFNDEMFDACRRFITWDMERIEKVAKPYANQHQCSLNEVDGGWFQIPASKCPQNYGYNGIRLKVPAAGTNVVLNFKGIAGAEGYSLVNTDKAGWRYGFFASLSDGSRVYGNVGRNPQDAAAFQVPENTEYLWLVVMGAPTEHWTNSMRRGAERKEEQWPYRIKLTGTTIDESFIE